MRLAEPISIAAVVEETERPALIAASEQLGECLGAALGRRWRIRLRFFDSIASVDPSERPTVVVASFLSEVARRDETISSTDARWRAQLRSLAGAAIPSVFVCTVFRHLTDGATRQRKESEPTTIERIRRLNLLAADLSHDTGIGVIDIDRVFAHFGARTLKTDYRLTGPLAAEVAGHTIVSSMLAVGLDASVAPEMQERAKNFQGNLWQIGRIVRRRLKLGERGKGWHGFA